MSQSPPGTLRYPGPIRVASERHGGNRGFGGSQQVEKEKCTLTSSFGRQIEVPCALFEAFEELEGKTGRIEVDMRRGGVAGVRTQKVLK